MQGGKHKTQDTAAVEPPRDEAAVGQMPPPKPELRPEIKSIVERNWKRDEEALRYLGS